MWICTKTSKPKGQAPVTLRDATPGFFDNVHLPVLTSIFQGLLLVYTNRIKWLVVVAHFGLFAATGSAHAAGGKVFVADEESNTVSIIDTTTLKTIGRVAVGQEPHNVQVTPDGKLVWVTNNGESAEENKETSETKMSRSVDMAGTAPGAVWAIDTATAKVVAKVPVGMHPAHVVVSGDGRTAYVTNGGDNSVSVVDTNAHQVIATIPVGTFPHGLRISPDGRQVWVANLKGETVSVIDTGSRKEIAKIAVGKGPAQVGFTPDGRFMFVSLSGENQVAVIDPASRKMIGKVAVGTVPIQLYATPDSKFVLVANQGSPGKPGNTVSFIDVAGLKVAATIKTGAGAHGLAITPDGRHAYVTNTYANTVSVIDIGDRKVIATVRVGKGPNGISITP